MEEKKAEHLGYRCPEFTARPSPSGSDHTSCSEKVHGKLWVVFGNRRLKAFQSFQEDVARDVCMRCIVHDLDRINVHPFALDSPGTRGSPLEFDYWLQRFFLV